MLDTQIYYMLLTMVEKLPNDKAKLELAEAATFLKMDPSILKRRLVNMARLDMRCEQLLHHIDCQIATTTEIHS